jgi:Fic family protein
LAQRYKNYSALLSIISKDLNNSVVTLLTVQHWGRLLILNMEESKIEVQFLQCQLKYQSTTIFNILIDLVQNCIISDKRYIFVADNIIKMYQPKIILTYELHDLRNRITKKKEILDAKRPIPSSVLDRLRQDFMVEWTYNSNHLEGNTLTISETKMVLEDGITIGGKTLREHFEVINHQKAIYALEGLVDGKYRLRSIDLLSLHQLVMVNIMDDFAGRLRLGMVRIVGANFTPPNASKVSDMIDELVTYIDRNPDDYDVISLATIFHHRFVWIHPFNDGNGRTVRLAMNLILMRAGYPPAFILSNDRKKYISALNSANTGDYSKLLLMMYQAMERSMNLYISAIGGQYDDYEPIASIVMEDILPYGQEYLSLLARKGRIDAYKEGNVWLTTRAAIKNYQATKLK